MKKLNIMRLLLSCLIVFFILMIAFAIYAENNKFIVKEDCSFGGQRIIGLKCLVEKYPSEGLQGATIFGFLLIITATFLLTMFLLKLRR